MMPISRWLLAFLVTRWRAVCEASERFRNSTQDRRTLLIHQISGVVPFRAHPHLTVGLLDLLTLAVAPTKEK